MTASEDAIPEHDRIGRLAVRLDVSRLVVVGMERSMSAVHHRAVMKGVRGSEGERAAAITTDSRDPSRSLGFSSDD
jgi:UDP-N-acetylmuramoyl-tripeptide--D-alanyl-D-alanine ligase